MKNKHCVNQIFRPHNSAKGLNQDGAGDCTVCVADSENEKCNLYTPISLIVFEIKDKKGES